MLFSWLSILVTLTLPYLLVPYLPQTTASTLLVVQSAEESCYRIREGSMHARRSLEGSPSSQRGGVRPRRSRSAAHQGDQTRRQRRRFSRPGAQNEADERRTTLQLQLVSAFSPADKQLHIGQIFDAVWARTSSHAIQELEQGAKRTWMASNQHNVQRSFRGHRKPDIARMVDQTYARHTDAMIQHSQNEYVNRALENGMQLGGSEPVGPSHQSYHHAKLQSIARVVSASRHDQWTAEREPTIEEAMQRLRQQHADRLWQSEREPLTQHITQQLRTQGIEPAWCLASALVIAR